LIRAIIIYHISVMLKMKKRSDKKMKMLTVFIPEKYLEYLDLMVLEDCFPNRSEAIRIAIRDLIRNEKILKNIIDKKKEKQFVEESIPEGIEE
jgi:antitoxin ParD1/3/4